MAVIQTTNQKSEGDRDPNTREPDSENTMTSSPLDSAVIQVTEIEDGPQDISQTTIPEEQIPEGGNSIKQKAVRKQVRRIHRKCIAQILMALFRNTLVWSGIIAFIVLLSQASIIFNDWGTPRLVIVVVIICGGVLAIGFHAHRAYLDLTFQKPTLIMALLRDGMSREEFNRKIQNRELSAPEVMFQVSLRGGTMSYEDPNHWTRSPGRKTTRDVPYRAWADQSMGVHAITWPSNHAAWVVVAKDFRCLDNTTMTSVESDAADFRKETDYTRNSYFMDFEYILQWKEADSCPDAEPFLVFQDERTGFYNVDVYRAAMLLCLDSIYRIVFHLVTTNVEDYYIVKFIER